jgi:hypothetical protein
LVTVIFQSVGITAGVTMKNEYSVHATGMDPAAIDTFSVAPAAYPVPSNCTVSVPVPAAADALTRTLTAYSRRLLIPPVAIAWVSLGAARTPSPWKLSE